MRVGERGGRGDWEAYRSPPPAPLDLHLYHQGILLDFKLRVLN